MIMTIVPCTDILFHTYRVIWHRYQLYQKCISDCTYVLFQRIEVPDISHHFQIKGPFQDKWHVFALALLYLFECLNE